MREHLTELVVPRSIPMIFFLVYDSSVYLSIHQQWRMDLTETSMDDQRVVARVSRSEFATTEELDNSMATAANIGFRKPDTANVMPKTL